MGGGLIQSGNYGRPKRPHTRTSVRGKKFDAGRGKQPVFEDSKFMTMKEKKLVYNNFKTLLKALSKPSQEMFHTENGSVAKNVDRAFTKRLYEHSHLHLGFIAHYNKRGFQAEYFNDFAGIQEYMSHLNEYEWGEYAGLNIAMYKEWQKVKQKIKWAWM